MSEKKVNDYDRLLKLLDCNSENFLMVGNSIKSDIIPVLELQSYAAHIPYHTTWAHEVHEQKLEHRNFYELKNISEILNYLN
ncbi:hypothetical protein D3C72_1473190 [compost metagenome]